MSPVREAVAELYALAEAARPDWDPDRLAGAFASARSGGMPWPRFYDIVTGCVRDEGATPQAILDAIRGPAQRSADAPGDWRAGAELARRMLAERGIDVPEPERGAA